MVSPSNRCIYRAMILILNYFEGVVAAESSSTVSSSCACVHRECFTMSVCAHESARVCVCVVNLM